MIVEVNLFGILKDMVEYSPDNHKVKLKENATVGTLIKMLKDFIKSGIKKTSMDSELDEPMLNTLILLNDREITLYNGLQTTLKDEDVVTIIPVSHGG